jgi:hypothetical protein
MRRRIIKISVAPPEQQANRPITIRPINSNSKINNPNINRPSNQAPPDRLVKHTREVPINETTRFLERKSNKVFIIGGGPSLSGLDLSFLDSEDVICVNKAIDLVKNPKYFITMDYSFFGKVGSSVRAITARAQSSHFIVNKQHQYIQNIKGVYTDTRTNFRYEGLGHFTSVISAFKETNAISGFGQNLTEFCHGDNSGYCAIQFALLAGYTEIYLLGFDLSEPVNSEQTHFHNSYPRASNSRFHQNINTYKRHLLGSITRIKRYSSANFYTITKSSLEPTVLRVPLSDFIPSINVRKTEPIVEKNNKLIQGLENLVIVAYYTVNTPYEDEAKKLIRSLNRLGLNHDVVGVANLGNWQANTRFKAKFMEDMLNKHQEKNLLYIDSDAIVHSRPVLFENYNADIAVRWQDFRWRKDECLSGTIFMANNEKTRELCRRWQKINTSEGPDATTFEQWNLGSVIKQMEAEGKLKTDNLPPEYTMIFDSMRAMYPNIVPVIEHFQASRKLKNKV